MENKLKLNTVLLVVIAILLVIGLSYFFLNQPKNKEYPYLQQSEQIKDKDLKEPIVSTNNDNVENNNIPKTNTAPVTSNKVLEAKDTSYENTPESKVSYEASGTFITDYQKRSDGYYYLTLDYYGFADNVSVPIVVNANKKLRTYKASKSLRVSLPDSGVTVPIDEYLGYLKKYNGTYSRQTNIYEIEPKSERYSVVIENGLIVNMNEEGEIQG